MFKKLILTLFFLILLAAGGASAWLYKVVALEPGDEISAENIESILGRESQVYYSDGVTKLGVFFDKAHRQYVKYSQIPSDFVNALVAAEDGRFFHHFGFDPVGIMRAMVENIRAGRVVQGGSTLTQQTAKNLFERKDRSYKAKLKELLYALRLEYHYPKEKIFEFYANQFYVSGNGHGLGVAARYYFDKKPSELTLVECAFIAGSVKRPNYYNPFIKKTEEGAERARQRARVRLRYVLDKMRETGRIDTTAYNEALATGVQFKKGRVGFSLDYTMELVREAVSSSAVRDALDELEIGNIASSGVRVITTVDKDLQKKTLASLRSELSRLDVRLRGYNRDEVQAELAALKYTGDSSLKRDAFIFATINSIGGKGKETRLKVELDKDLGDAVIGVDGLKRMVLAYVRYNQNRWSEAKTSDIDAFVKELKEGDRVWVSVKNVGSGGAPTLCDLEKYPTLQGGALVLHKGEIRSIVGGSENRFYNRAIHAQRTMGSAFKPVVYTAALQLGWNSADTLKNERDLFVYHGQPYFPRPDHNSPHKWVSMSWAGVHSENVASVWLLAHLCDKLSPGQFHDVADQVGLVPKIIDGETEPYRTYRVRIRDRHGIQVTKEALREAAYYQAVDNLETDFIFDDMMEEYNHLQDLHYGRNFDNYLENIENEIVEEKARKKVRQSVLSELNLRKSALADSFLKIEALWNDLENVKRQIELSLAHPFPETTRVSPAGSGASFYVHAISNTFYFLPEEEGHESLSTVNLFDLLDYLEELSPSQRETFWKELHLNRNLTVAAFDKTRLQVEHEYEKLLQENPYSFEVLAKIPDFRITVGLFYLRNLCRELGISSDLEPVLSFPLGSNVVTLLEATRMYEAMVSTTVTTFVEGEKDEENDAIAIINRIESSDGRLLYQPQRSTRKVLDDNTSLAVGSVLENIVKFGTGRRANNIVTFSPEEDKDAQSEIDELNLVVPLLGKTGTANNYTNAAFLGYLPQVGDDGVSMTLADGFAIGVYVGFDDNSSMRRNSSRISGSAGALPAWSNLANALIEEQHYADRLDPIDLSFYGLAIKRPEIGQINVAVDAESGGTVVEPVTEVNDLSRETPSIITFGKKSSTGRFVMERNFQPYWKTQKEAVE